MMDDSAFRPDVALLEIGRLRLNGDDACRGVRGESWARDVVCVAVTGWGRDGDRCQPKAAGFDFHMIKPVDAHASEKRLTGLLKPGLSPHGSCAAWLWQT